MNSVDALERARELVRTGWCQGSAAKMGDGRECMPTHEHAAQFCTDGAVVRVTWPWHEEESEELWGVTSNCWDYLVSAIRELYGWDCSEQTPWAIIHDWNDETDRTKDEVVALFTAAIEKAREV